MEDLSKFAWRAQLLRSALSEAARFGDRDPTMSRSQQRVRNGQRKSAFSR